jgi:hypothetical protein
MQLNLGSLKLYANQLSSCRQNPESSGRVAMFEFRDTRL